MRDFKNYHLHGIDTQIKPDRHSQTKIPRHCQDKQLPSLEEGVPPYSTPESHCDLLRPPQKEQNVQILRKDNAPGVAVPARSSCWASSSKVSQCLWARMGRQTTGRCCSTSFQVQCSSQCIKPKDCHQTCFPRKFCKEGKATLQLLVSPGCLWPSLLA